MSKTRVLLAMSGGIDSSTAAYLLKQAGYEVTGIFMSLGLPGVDAKDARQVAGALDIHLEVFNFEKEFRRVLDYFCEEYLHGRTPNPCIRCNQWLKFGRLLELADVVHADCVATGHYARVEKKGGRFLLKRGIDRNKDQAYVLAGLTQEQLAYALFPLGERTKSEVRELAAEVKLPAREKPESQEICFVPDDDYGRVIRERFPERVKPGPIRDLSGNYLGEHPGIQFFTIGQRRGLGIALGEPRYVVEINPSDNSITVGKREDLLKARLIATDLNWIAFARLTRPLEACARIRYSHPACPCLIEPIALDKVQVSFATPQFAITPGQAVVFYDDDLVLGSGWIENAFS